MEGSTRDERIEQLWRDHATALHRYLARRGARRHEIDDLVTDAFVAAIRLPSDELEQLRPGWLFTVAFRRLVDRRRAADRHDRTIDRIRCDRAPAQRFEDNLVRRLGIEADLADLGHRQRRALELRYLEGRSVGDVAAQLGVSYRAAESLLARSRRALTLG